MIQWLAFNQRVFQQRLECMSCLPIVAKATGYWVGWPLFWQQQIMQHPYRWTGVTHKWPCKK